jgi:hypothetical protein
MKRVALAGAFALLFLLVPSQLDAQTTSDVSFVNASGSAPLDLYIGPSSGSTVSLAAANIGTEAVVDLGALESGNYRFLVCVHAANPLPVVSACTDNSVGKYVDQKQSIGVDKFSEVVFGVNENGVQKLAKFNIDTGCVSPGGRLQFANMADSEPAAVTLDGTSIADSLESGKSVKTTALAGTHTLAMTDGAALDLSVPLDVASQRNTIAYLQGGPKGYAVVAVHQVDLGCSTPPPTNGSTTGTDPSAVNAGTTTGVSPRFTG